MLLESSLTCYVLVPLFGGDMTEYICLVHFRCDAPNALLAVNNRPS